MALLGGGKDFCEGAQRGICSLQQQKLQPPCTHYLRIPARPCRRHGPLMAIPGRRDIFAS